MLKSKIYSEYFPVKNNHTQFTEEDKQTLSKWVREFRTEVLARELEKWKQYMNCYTYRLDDFDENTMINMIAQNQFDDYGLAMLNFIIYRHKYNTFLSLFVFPVLTKSKAMSIFGEINN